LEPQLLLDESNPRILRFNEETAKEIATACRRAISRGDINKLYKSLRCVLRVAEQALNKYGGDSIRRIPVAQRLCQLRISLKDIEPEIWRRIQVKDCTLDRLHLHVQLAMGWDNYHLHQFKINGVIHGDPELLCEGFLDDPEKFDAEAVTKKMRRGRGNWPSYSDEF
jgi:hypothetical protein